MRWNSDPRRTANPVTDSEMIEPKRGKFVSVGVLTKVLRIFEALQTLRNAHRDTFVFSDGSSCREQIAQTTSRITLYLAQIIQLALRSEAKGRA